MIRRVVITGGPCCGKTTLCDTLTSFGELVVPESARDIIAKNQPNGILPQTNLYEFQRLVANECLRREDAYMYRAKQDKKHLLFFDRTEQDSIGYCSKANVLLPMEVSRLQKYDVVLALDALPYVNDAHRHESPQDAQEIHDHIIRGYKSIGYDVLSIPVDLPANRALRVMSMLREFYKSPLHGGYDG